MRNKILVGILAAVLIGLLAAPAQAAGNMKNKLEKLREADTNGDKAVTFEEAQAAFPNITQERFNKLDKNSDGKLTKEDAKEVIKEKFAEADKNGDGKLTFEEAHSAFPRLTQSRFDKLDRNGDGYLDKSDRKK
jgi:Ca2+-binding EF-hand superfamily protein